MKGKGLLAALLLAVGVCFVPALGYGVVHEWTDEIKVSALEFNLLAAKVGYMMERPTNFLNVRFIYDPDGLHGKVAESGADTGYLKLPKGADTNGKILVMVFDSRGEFSDRSRTALLGQFKRELELIFKHLWSIVATDMDTDMIASFWGRGDIPLGYFYQGEYHLWEG